MYIVMMMKKPVCPNCGSTDHYKFGFTAEKKQRYQCKSCGRSYILPEDHSRQPSGHVCPRCGSLNVIWRGRTLLTGGRQKRRLRCKDCRRNFYPPEEAEIVESG